ncbi:MAG: NUDIX hydrolase [Armatimonadota bacterium]
MDYPKPAVSALIIKHKKVLLVRRGHEPNKGKWSLPGGSVELGETLQEAVCREVFEETSLEIEIGDIAYVYDVIAGEGSKVLYHYVIICYWADVIAGNIMPGSDAEDVMWHSIDGIDNLETTSGLADIIKSALHSVSE